MVAVVPIFITGTKSDACLPSTVSAFPDKFAFSVPLTVTMDVAGAVKAVKAGQVEYRVESAGQIHAGVGKISFSEAQIKENIITFAQAILKAKPASVKGTYLKRVALSTTQGVGVKVSVSNIASLASGN